MSRIAYVNGRYVPHALATVHVEDRGYQFADGVYEVIAFCNGKLVDAERHISRLWRSMAALSIDEPTSPAILGKILITVARKNRLTDGLIYLQVTRGVAKRDFPFPANVRPSLVVTARRGLWHTVEKAKKGVAVITYPDQRWSRRDIKTVALLPSVLAKQAAVDAGAYEAWMVEGDGIVTEGSSSTSWIVTDQGALITRPNSQSVLPGVTRQTVDELAKQHGYTIEERSFTVDEAKRAKEAFLTSASSFVLPVVKIDDVSIGTGAPGPLTVALRDQYISFMLGQGAGEGDA